MRVADYVRLARPRDWVKNVFVFGPVPFAIAAGGAVEWRPLAIGLLGFCFVTSAIYALNDTVDAARDRLHPVKRERPVAAGRIPTKGALVLALELFVVGALLVHLSGRPLALAIVGVYLAVNVGYSLGGRSVPLLDVALLASGFVLRVLLGCALIDRPPSNWLLLCSLGLALFLALTKRRAELVAGTGPEHRASLGGYSRAFLEHAMAVTTGLTLITYALYCLEAEVLLPGRELASLPFAILGVLEYLRQAHVRGAGDSPVDVLFSSPTLWVCGAGWVATALWSVGLP